MAYNPFNIFRRNQKALFAVLTVFIMIMFTLSFGRGDFFDTLATWLGKGRGSGDVVCKIDGRKITAGELESGTRSVQFRRVMANRFMSLAAEQVARTLEAHLVEQQAKLGSEGRQTVTIALRVADEMNNPQAAAAIARDLPELIDLMNQRIDSPTARSEDKDAAYAARTLFELFYKLALGGHSHYFLNAPSTTRRHHIEFLLWEKKADQLGIKFTRDDVDKLVQNEFSGFFRSDVDVRRVMQQQTQGFTMETCRDALTAEFRVRAAQAAVLGQMIRGGRAPAYPTPYEAFEYYREQCSPATYEMVPVPAAAFLDQVTATPTDAEISDLYKKYADVEPDPRRETPGFKEPRKISVGWLGITGEEPYYTKLAEEQIKVGEVMAKASGLLTVPLPGSTATWAAGAVAPLTVKEPAVDAAYNARANQFRGELRNQYSNSLLFVRDLLDSSVVRPGVLAATLGGFVGQAAGHGGVAQAVSVSLGAPIGYEIRDRVKVGVPLVLAGLPGPGLLQTAITGGAAATASEPKPLPIEYLRPELLKDAVAARAKAIAFGDPRARPTDPTQPPDRGDVGRFIEDLKKMTEDGRPKDKAATEKIEKYIQDFIASRGLKPLHHGKSTEPRDEWSLEDDPGLLPLVLAQRANLPQGGDPFHSNEYTPFGQSFFWTRVFDQNTFRLRRGPATSGLYQAETYPPSAREPFPGQPRYVVWRNLDVPAAKTNAITAKPAVIAAWKRMKARELAKAYADRMAEAIRGYAGNDVVRFAADKAFELEVKVADPKVRRKMHPFPVTNVAPFVDSTNPLLAIRGQGGLEPFDLKPSENLPYPTPEMQTALLENRDKPERPVTALVLPDAPKDTYYVATLIDRRLKTPDDFRRDVYSPRGKARGILGQFYFESSRKARESAVDLLKKEFNYEETEEQKKKLDENTKSGGRSDE